MNTVKLLILVCFLAPAIAHGQTYRETSSSNHLWMTYSGNHKFSNKLGLNIGVQVRRQDYIKDWQQLLLCTGLNIHTANVRYTIGYGFMKTYTYGEYPVASAFPEHRIWQQALLTQNLGSVGLNHRFLLEQRFIGNAATGEFSNGRYENRFRYMVRATVPLQGKTVEPKEFYLGFSEEAMINFGKNVKYNIFDQNRLYAGLGYHLGKIGKIEVGYLLQTAQGRGLDTTFAPPRTIIKNNHTVQVGFSSSYSFFHQKLSEDGK